MTDEEFYSRPTHGMPLPHGGPFGVTKKTMNKTELRNHMQQLFIECLEISKKKNHDYTQGGENALKNFELVEYLGITDTSTGIAVRLADKFSRIATLLKREGMVSDEKMSDTIKDAINYLAILDASLTINK